MFDGGRTGESVIRRGRRIKRKCGEAG